MLDLRIVGYLHGVGAGGEGRKEEKHEQDVKWENQFPVLITWSESLIKET